MACQVLAHRRSSGWSRHRRCRGSTHLMAGAIRPGSSQVVPALPLGIDVAARFDAVVECRDDAIRATRLPVVVATGGSSRPVLQGLGIRAVESDEELASLDLAVALAGLEAVVARWLLDAAGAHALRVRLAWNADAGKLPPSASHSGVSSARDKRPFLIFVAAASVCCTVHSRFPSIHTMGRKCRPGSRTRSRRYPRRPSSHCPPGCGMR